MPLRVGDIVEYINPFSTTDNLLFWGLRNGALGLVVADNGGVLWTCEGMRGHWLNGTLDHSDPRGLYHYGGPDSGVFNQNHLRYRGHVTEPAVRTLHMRNFSEVTESYLQALLIVYGEIGPLPPPAPMPKINPNFAWRSEFTKGKSGFKDFNRKTRDD